MSKVPVGKSIAHAYSFLFGRFFQIIGTAWLPSLIYATGYYFWLQNSATWLAPLTQDHQLLVHGVAATAGFVVLALFTRAVLGISLTQEALGIRKDLTLAHFVIGPRELRLVFAQIRLILVILLLDIVVVAVVVLGLGAAAKYGAAIPPAPLIGGKSLVVVGAMVAAVLIYIAFVLTVLKLSFLLTAVASVEHRASVRRGWQLAGGSGWRIVLVLLGTFLPLVAIVCGVVYAVAGADLAATMHGAADPAARSHAMLQFYAGHALLLSVVVGIVSVVAGALMAGATAAAYRTVTGHEEAEPEDDAALVAPLLAPVESHGDHGHGGGHDDQGHGGHDDQAHGGHDDHGHGDKGHGHDDHGHGGHDDHGHNNGHDDGHGGHGHDDHGHGDDDHGHDDHGHGETAHGHDDHGHGNGHDDHGHGGHDDHGHGGHGHDDHGHGSQGDGHHHHARAA